MALLKQVKKVGGVRGNTLTSKKQVESMKRKAEDIEDEDIVNEEEDDEEEEEEEDYFEDGGDEEDDDEEDEEDEEDEDEDEEGEEGDEDEEIDEDIEEEEEEEETQKQTKGKKKIEQIVPVPTKKRNQKVLLLSSRGITHRFRHLLKDFHKLLPHCKKESKLDAKTKLYLINEIADMNLCNNCIFFETRKKEDLYIWFSRVSQGPSVKFYAQNVHTMEELNMTGNCLKGSRPLLSFDASFESKPYYKLIKELFIQILGTPKGHPKSKPFFDHVFNFTIADDKIWFRNFQITEHENENGEKGTTLVEIGPRLVLTIIRIFGGSFGGPTLYQNSTFVSPNEVRRAIKQNEAKKHAASKIVQVEKRMRKDKIHEPSNPLDSVFK